jgi:hypothetical protein
MMRKMILIVFLMLGGLFAVSNITKANPYITNVSPTNPTICFTDYTSSLSFTVYVSSGCEVRWEYSGTTVADDNVSSGTSSYTLPKSYYDYYKTNLLYAYVISDGVVTDYFCWQLNQRYTSDPTDVHNWEKFNCIAPKTEILAGYTNISPTSIYMFSSKGIFQNYNPNRFTVPSSPYTVAIENEPVYDVYEPVLSYQVSSVETHPDYPNVPNIKVLGLTQYSRITVNYT